MGSSPIMRLSHTMKFLINSNPVTPGTRHFKYIKKNLLCKKNKLVKHLNFKIKQFVGRSATTGHITVWGRGAGCKTLYRQITCLNTTNFGILLFSFYDPNRTGFVSLFFNLLTLKFSYRLAVKNTTAGSVLVTYKSTNTFKFRCGFRYPVYQQPVGSFICAISLTSIKSPQLALAGGTYCVILRKNFLTGVCQIKMPSNQILRISSLAFGTLGRLSNSYHKYTKKGKAGRNRLLGFRPSVRGIAMNPVDHPHGGRSNGGCEWVTPWGKSFRHLKTSRSKIQKIFKAG